MRIAIIDTGRVDAAIAGAEVLILPTPLTATEALISEHAPALADKIVIDAINPLNAGATRLTHGFDSSGVELLQSHAHGATFFKAFNPALNQSQAARPCALEAAQVQEAG